MDKKMVQPGSRVADEKYRIKITADGPVMVYGRPPLKQEFIMPDHLGQCWYFADGDSYPMDHEPVALCRCGGSGNKPYCDGAHVNHRWDPSLRADPRPLLEGAKEYDGPELVLSDNEKYCVFARFCDAKGRVWNIVGESDDPVYKEYTIHEANMCPGGRLTAWEKDNGRPHEPEYEPSLGLIEDKPLKMSGGLWVKGGIPVEHPDGFTYEIRNRVVLCRCGQASNKPFCDGTHASMKFRDGLATEPHATREEEPELARTAEY